MVFSAQLLALIEPTLDTPETIEATKDESLSVVKLVVVIIQKYFNKIRAFKEIVKIMTSNQIKCLAPAAGDETVVSTTTTPVEPIKKKRARKPPTRRTAAKAKKTKVCSYDPSTHRLVRIEQESKDGDFIDIEQLSHLSRKRLNQLVELLYGERFIERLLMDSIGNDDALTYSDDDEDDNDDDDDYIDSDREDVPFDEDIVDENGTV